MEWAELPARARSSRERAIWRSSSDAGMAVGIQVSSERFQRLLADQLVAGFLVAAQAIARALVELREEVEGDVGGLVILRVGRRDIVAERAQGGRARQGARGRAESESGGVHAGREPGGDGFDVAFDAGNLAGEKDFGVCAQLQRGGEEGGGVDVGVAVDLAEAQEFGVPQAGNEA